MAVFPLLSDPAGYRANTIDMVDDESARDYWLKVFETQVRKTARLAAESEGDDAGARERGEEFAAEWSGTLAEIRREPLSRGELSIVLLCTLRQEALERFGFEDPYRQIKRAENEAALRLLPGVLAEHDAEGDGAAGLMRLVQGVFAGNIFDLGCENTIALYETGSIGFHETRLARTARPWLVDDFEELSERLGNGSAHGKAVMFVDNAGSDVVLGMIPLARHMLVRGTRVVLTANTRPALNDIIHSELVELMERVAGFDAVTAEALRTGRLEMVASGNGIPGIDLSRVSEELASAAADADLVILEGMGRALETNYDAALSVDALKLAMVKEQAIAEMLGGRLYDVVCRFEPGGAIRTGSGRPQPAT